MTPANLVNFLDVTKAYGERPLLAGVSLGVGSGDRIGIVGRNGAGKTTLLRLLAGTEQPDTGRIAHAGDARVLLVSQTDANDPTLLVRDVIGGSSGWERDARAREIIASLLGADAAETMLDRPMGELSGGERRRAQLAAALIAGAGESDASTLLLLDEPTNHLDIEAVAWLAEHLKSRPRLALAVVTHDRWFLDEVSERTWEVVGGEVEEYDGGYSAYVLAKAERSRQAAASEARRQNLLRKELAWLRRGAPARTSKPKFRIDAANELIANEPPPRDAVELLAFANARLGKTVFELHDATISVGPADARRELAEHVNLDIGPGQRLGVLGPNGAGKTTLIRMLLGQVKPSAGRLVTGSTVKPAFLSQHLDELDPSQRVLESVEHIAQRVELGKGRELTASQLCERLGFGADGQWTPVGDLSGGERRRLQLIRLLMSGPNVLVLDEPTNDFDVETLAALEDLLDGFAGTLIVVSHDRYFLERVCDGFLAITGGQVRDLPRGIDEYLERRAQVADAPQATRPAADQTAAASDAARKRQAGKDLARIERQIAKLNDAETKLHEQLAAHAADYAKVAELDTKLRTVVAERDDLEAQWLDAAEHT